MQLLLFPDSRPLVETLGRDFFRNAPREPGLYFMRNAAGSVLYIGKAKNLRNRLSSYRVANPDRLKKRHLALLRMVTHVDLQTCPDEHAALAREAELLCRLQPKFNRAGKFRPAPQFLCWRLNAPGLELALGGKPEEGWRNLEVSSGGRFLYQALARVLWQAVNPAAGMAGMPHGWLGTTMPRTLTIQLPAADLSMRSSLEESLVALSLGSLDVLKDLIDVPCRKYECQMLEADLETLSRFAKRTGRKRLQDDAPVHS